MGYTHYWRRPEVLDQEDYNLIVNDFKKLVPIMEKIGLKLAGGLGEGVPEINHEEVRFNGLSHCGHSKNSEVVIPWPTDTAQGVGDSGHALAGQWFAGTLLSSRTCDGDCSYETFHFPRVFRPEDWEKLENGLYFEFCKTAFRPYDLAVNCFLIIAKHYLGKRIRVTSDGEDVHWEDGRKLCQQALGYGSDFGFDD